MFTHSYMSKQFYFKQFCLAKAQFQCQKQFHFKQFILAQVRSLNVETVLLQAIQFSISTLFSAIRPIDKTLSGPSIPGQTGPGSDGNEVVLCITQSSSITGTSPSGCLVSYPGQSLGGVLPCCRKAVNVFYSPNRLGNHLFVHIKMISSIEDD